MATNLPGFTVALVRSIYAGSFDDAYLQSNIDDFDSKFGACLFSNYGDLQGSRLAAWGLVYTLSSFEGIQTVTGTIKSETAPNGSSVTYDNSTMSARASNYIDTFDTAGCLSSLFVQAIGMFTINGGYAP